MVAIRAAGKNPRCCLTNFAKGHLHHTAPKLGNNLIHWNRNHDIGKVGLPDDSSAHLQGKHRDDCLQRNPDLRAVAAIGIGWWSNAHGFGRRRRLRPHYGSGGIDGRRWRQRTTRFGSPPQAFKEPGEPVFCTVRGGTHDGSTIPTENNDERYESDCQFVPLGAPFIKNMIHSVIFRVNVFERLAQKTCQCAAYCPAFCLPRSGLTSLRIKAKNLDETACLELSHRWTGCPHHCPVTNAWKSVLPSDYRIAKWVRPRHMQQPATRTWKSEIVPFPEYHLLSKAVNQSLISGLSLLDAGVSR